MLHYEPKELSVVDVHKLLLGGVAPRPIALVSTISVDGIHNLSPFSFFNAFGANPPIIAFSPARRGRDASLKDTYINIKNTGECVVQVVTYDMVEQINLASAEFPPDINEFDKCGLTPIASDLVKPMRVKESPFQMECILRDLLSYGSGGASANIAICEVLKFHVDENIFQDRIIHPDKIDLVARMGGDFYTRAVGNSLFKLQKPEQKLAIGFDKLPSYIKDSGFFSSNELAKLASVSSIPSIDDVFYLVNEIKKLRNFESKKNEDANLSAPAEYQRLFHEILNSSDTNKSSLREKLHQSAKLALLANDKDFAWKVLIYSSLNQ